MKSKALAFKREPVLKPFTRYVVQIVVTKGKTQYTKYRYLSLIHI